MNYLSVIKEGVKKKDKKTENLVLLVILLVILLLAINFIFKSDENSDSTSISENINSNESDVLKEDTVSMEKKLENILSKINGIEDVSVMITYSSLSKQNIAYNTQEESTDSTTKVEKEVAYNEQSGEKTAIVESVENPKVEGVIIVAKGANTVEIKSKIATAVAMAVNVAVYKVQVFEK